MADDPEFQKSLTANIKDVLGHLSENEASDVSKYLRSKGVRKLPDLKHITVNILNEKLNFIESSELFSKWQDSYGTRQPDEEPGTSKNTTRRPLSTVRHNARATLQTDLPVFTEDSPYFPSGIKKAIRAEKRPTRSDRESMCERIVDHCREVVPNLERSRLNDVAKQIVEHFPKSFKDTILISAHRSDSLALQLRTKFDNNDRKLKRPKAPLEEEAPATKEAYGCVLWEAPLPAGTTEESLENIRLDMKKTYRVSRKDWDWRVIKKQLQDSYYLQRKHINANAVKTQKQAGPPFRQTSLPAPLCYAGNSVRQGACLLGLPAAFGRAEVTQNVLLACK
ncbi:Serine hydroxymethyltransferase [Frankliniella fusca]|uniref:Serine hydroxymethyltransferase n=1 Tax=Frankliniella fusca TaxID=407009 RepID=A0AAE1HJY5_9NEOP|nr:Serine hydroxymethyltransferase [Frankliniella fusca]